MPYFLTAYRGCINLLLRSFVKDKNIPNDPIAELALDQTQPFIYLLPYGSQTDLLLLRRNCLALGLPDPLEMNEIDGHKLARYAYLDKYNLTAKTKTVNESTKTLFTEYFELHQKNPQLDVQLLPVSALWGRAPGKAGKQES